jgi:hypothetical protein
MFAINKKTKTKKGETVVPYLVDGDLVYCKNSSGKVIIKKLEDFEFKKETKKEAYKKVIKVEPSLEPEDVIFTEDEKIDVDIVEEPVKEVPVKNVPVKKEPVKLIYGDTIKRTPISNEDYI